MSVFFNIPVPWILLDVCFKTGGAAGLETGNFPLFVFSVEFWLRCFENKYQASTFGCGIFTKVLEICFSKTYTIICVGKCVDRLYESPSKLGTNRFVRK